ncbi:MAG: hypothetical protein ACI9G1_005133, partial [Pirellulaceae bacterium]
MTNNAPDPKIDTRLRDVPLPDGFMQRLRDSVAPTDDELDGELCNVAIPNELAASLRSVAADAILDEQLLAVDLPAGALARLRVIPDLRERSWVGQLAVAAGWLLIVGLSYSAAMYSVFDSVIPRPQTPDTLVLVYGGPLEIEAVSPTAVVELELNKPLQTQPIAGETAWWSEQVALMSEVDRTRGPAGELLDELRSGMDPWKDTLLIRWGVVGYPQYTDDKLPDLERVLPLIPRGMETPILPGYDRQFLFLKGTHPQIVLQNSHPDLQRISPPLSVRTDSMLEFERQLESDGRLADSSLVRVEDFLAAMDYGYDDPGTGLITMNVSAGPSLFAAPGVAMLHVGVKAGQAPLLETEKTHITIALDISASMRWEQRLKRCQLALQKMTEH